MQHADLYQFIPKQAVYTDLTELLRCRLLAQSLRLNPLFAKSKQSGFHRSREFGRGLEFEELRIYQAGDDIRTIDWRVTARTGKTHTRLYGEEREVPSLLLVDQRPSMFFGSHQCMKSVLACHLAAIIAWQTLQGNDRIGGFVFDEKHHQFTEPKRNRRNLMILLQSLTEFNQGLNVRPTVGLQTLSSSIQKILQLKKHGSRIFIISDFNEDLKNLTKQLEALSKHNQLHLLQINDALEFSEELPGNFAVSDGSTISLLNKSVHKEMLNTRLANRDALYNWALNRRISYSSCITGDSPKKWLEAIS